LWRDLALNFDVQALHGPERLPEIIIAANAIRVVADHASLEAVMTD